MEDITKEVKEGASYYQMEKKYGIPRALIAKFCKRRGVFSTHRSRRPPKFLSTENLTKRLVRWFLKG